MWLAKDDEMLMMVQMSVGRFGSSSFPWIHVNLLRCWWWSTSGARPGSWWDIVGPAHCKPPSHAILNFCIPSFELLFSNCFNLLGRNKGTFVCTNLKSINFSFVFFQVKIVEIRKRGREKRVQSEKRVQRASFWADPLTFQAPPGELFRLPPTSNHCQRLSAHRR